jgi:hypothetical protein
MLSQFRSAGAAFLGDRSDVEILFLAQHFGMPTRLLDWSTNPLARLFFACDGDTNLNGAVYAMDARFVIPDNAVRNNKSEKLYQSVMTMRHPHIVYATAVSFWSPVKNDMNPYILPVRPDILPGRIGQQSSCFTFHMHDSKPVTNETLIVISVPGNQKITIREELHRLNIDQFTAYYDLDHLSKEIRRTFGLPESR